MFGLRLPFPRPINLGDVQHPPQEGWAGGSRPAGSSSISPLPRSRGLPRDHPGSQPSPARAEKPGGWRGRTHTCACRCTCVSYTHAQPLPPPFPCRGVGVQPVPEAGDGARRCLVWPRLRGELTASNRGASDPQDVPESRELPALPGEQSGLAQGSAPPQQDSREGTVPRPPPYLSHCRLGVAPQLQARWAQHQRPRRSRGQGDPGGCAPRPTGPGHGAEWPWGYCPPRHLLPTAPGHPHDTFSLSCSLRSSAPRHLCAGRLCPHFY